MQPIKIDKLIRSKRKSVALEINLAGQLIIRAPNRVSIGWITDYVQQKSPWILAKQQLLKAHIQQHRPKEFVTGENFLFLGQYYPLAISSSDFNTKFAFNNEFKIHQSAAMNAKTLLLAWYKQQAKTSIVKQVELYATQYNFHYKKIKLSNAKTRWGSCSRSGNLNFNWRLIMAPLHVINYVIVHELSHLQEMNHSKKFWKLVESIMPDYQSAKIWLKQHSRELHLFD